MRIRHCLAKAGTWSLGTCVSNLVRAACLATLKLNSLPAPFIFVRGCQPFGVCGPEWRPHCLPSPGLPLGQKELSGGWGAWEREVSLRESGRSKRPARGRGWGRERGTKTKSSLPGRGSGRVNGGQKLRFCSETQLISAVVLLGKRRTSCARTWRSLHAAPSPLLSQQCLHCWWL